MGVWGLKPKRHSRVGSRSLRTAADDGVMRNERRLLIIPSHSLQIRENCGKTPTEWPKCVRHILLGQIYFPLWAASTCLLIVIASV